MVSLTARSAGVPVVGGAVGWWGAARPSYEPGLRGSRGQGEPVITAEGVVVHVEEVTDGQTTWTSTANREFHRGSDAVVRAGLVRHWAR